MEVHGPADPLPRATACGGQRTMERLPGWNRGGQIARQEGSPSGLAAATAAVGCLLCQGLAGAATVITSARVLWSHSASCRGACPSRSSPPLFLFCGPSVRLERLPTFFSYVSFQARSTCHLLPEAFSDCSELPLSSCGYTSNQAVIVPCCHYVSVRDCCDNAV